MTGTCRKNGVKTSTQLSLNEKQVLTLATFVGLAGIIYGALYYFLEKATILAFCTAICGSSSFLGVYLLKKINKINYSGHFLLFCFALALGLIQYVSHPLPNAGSWWLVAIPLLSFFLVEKKGIIFWMIAPGVLIIFPILSKKLGINPLQNYSHQSSQLFDQIALVGLYALVSGSSYINEKTRRKAEKKLQNAQKVSLQSAHAAGMSEIASNVLHNIGNTINSASISTEEITSLINTSSSNRLKQLIEFISENIDQNGNLNLAGDNEKRFPEYLHKIYHHLEKEEHSLQVNVDDLKKSLVNIKNIIYSLDSLTGIEQSPEIISVDDLINQALDMCSVEPDSIQIIKGHKGDIIINAFRMRLLQILVSLLHNAQNALHEVNFPKLTITLTHFNDSELQIQVIDNGKGIAKDDMKKIFSFGFTTKKGGLGLNLHNSALVAQELGGTLRADSPGPGKGATFTLIVPINRA